MSIQKVNVRSFKSLIRRFEDLALAGSGGSFTVFRGHRETSWRLCSTFSRFSTSRLPEYTGQAINQITERFIHGLATIDNFALAKMSRREKLEMARHHGVPSPLIDVSYSPFVALWFAFNGIRGSVDQGDAVVYAINWNCLAAAYSKVAHEMGWEQTIRSIYGKHILDMFRWDISSFFEKGYPQPILKFVPYASSSNKKAQRQMGCFIYDTLDYSKINALDLEDLIDKTDASVRVGEKMPTLIKFFVPKRMAGEVFD